MCKLKTWFARVEIRPRANNLLLVGMAGAYVPLLVRGSTRAELVDHINQHFNFHDFDVVEIDEIKPVNSKDDLGSPELAELLDSFPKDEFVRFAEMYIFPDDPDESAD